MTTGLLEVPTDFTAYDLAQWVEVTMILEDLQTFTRAGIENRFPVNQRPDAAEMDELFAEIGRRAESFPSYYPHRAVDEEIKTADEADPTVYRLLVVLSIESAPFRTEYRYNEISPSLELITCEALRGMMGSDGQARRFGWPNDDGRPENLGKAIEWIAEEMGDLEVSKDLWDDVNDDDNDAGVDAVAWVPFSQGGILFPVHLVQITTQIDFKRKPQDVLPERWSSWIRFGTSPQVGLAVPFTIPTDAKVVKSILRYSADLLLDRLRLCDKLEGRDLTGFDEYAYMAEWTTAEIEKITAVLTGPPPETGRKKKPGLPKIKKPMEPSKLAPGEAETGK